MISVTILTKNSDKYLDKVLSALVSFDEVVIFDTGSTDKTETIAKSFSNVSWHRGSFKGFGPTHNEASSLAKHDWILSLDSDEVMTEELASEIFSLTLDDQTAYSFWRKNFYHGRHIWACGWYPDRVTRLYNRKSTRFSDVKVHEKVLTEGLKRKALQAPVLHFPFDTVSSFLKKIDVYSGLFESTKKSSIKKAFFHALFSFLRSYIIKGGFLLGAEGLEISWYNMNCAFYKYAKLSEKQSLLQKKI